MTDSNGIAPDSKPVSALAKLLAEIKDGPKPNASDLKATTAAFKTAMGKRAELQKALDDFDAKADATAVAMVRCYGAKHVVVGGVRYVPTSRGERIYYKKMSDSHDTIEL